MSKATKPLFASLDAVVNLRCDGDAKYTNTQLAADLNRLGLPIFCDAGADGSLSVRISYPFPPSLEEQKAFFEYLVQEVVPKQKNVYKSITY